MEFKRNLEYFIGKPFMSILGAVVSLFGLIMTVLFLSANRNNIIKAMQSWYTILAIVILVAGVVILVIANGKKSKVADIDNYIETKVRDIQDKNIQKMNPATEGKSKTPPPELLKAYPPLILRGEDFTGTEKKYVKKKADGKFRSSMYAVASVIFTEKRLCVVKRRFSLVEDIYTEDFNGLESVSAYNFGTPYQDITYAALEDGTCDAESVNGPVTVNYKKIVIKAGDDVILEMSVIDDSDVDRTIESVLALAQRKRSQA